MKKIKDCSLDELNILVAAINIEMAKRKGSKEVTLTGKAILAEPKAVQEFLDFEVKYKKEEQDVWQPNRVIYRFDANDYTDFN